MSTHTLTNKQMPRVIGLFGLTLSGITCMIGSGWLFGAYHAAKMAGPAAIFSWIIGGIAILLIALTISELATMFPSAGGMARYMNYSHGTLAGFISGWANWLAIAVSIPAEATASIQYLSSVPWQWCQNLFNVQTGLLTTTGIIGAVILTFFYFLLNYWAIQLFMRFIISTTIIKIVVPIITAVLLYVTSFHADNFTVQTQGFAPYGWAAMLTAIATCGIIFSFNGFQAPANFAGEAKRPEINLPLAIIGSILFTLILYVILQVVFIGAISPQDLLSGQWHGLQFSSPFAQLAIAFNMNVLLLLLYADAFLSPSVTGIAYMGSTTRMLYGMQQHGFLPGFIGKLNERYLIPRGALWVNFAVSLLFLFIYRDWEKLAGMISAITVLSYLVGPVAAVGLRRILPDLRRKVTIPGLHILAPVAFVIVTLLFYWSRWPLTGHIIAMVTLGILTYFFYQRKTDWQTLKPHIKSSVWLITYIVVIALLSYLGSSDFGGINFIKVGWDQLVVALTALLFYQWGIYSAWRTPELITTIDQKK